MVYLGVDVSLVLWIHDKFRPRFLLPRLALQTPTQEQKPAAAFLSWQADVLLSTKPFLLFFRVAAAWHLPPYPPKPIVILQKGMPYTY